ncbi:MAG: hypothetical protein LKK21_07220 [Prevotella sp.]|jgi:hypothetical protein|nr:hypothetical protein [Prevotella sp.]MCI2088024.1 hypothetical protein [Prevotella sp.]MCI2125421.1 hypothetical protein [Prevotella sp.]
MKKLVFSLVALLLIVGSANAQKIKVNEIDKFSKKQVIETSFEKIVSDRNVLGSTGDRLMKNIWIAFRKVGNNDYLRLKWCSNQVISMSKDADVILLDKDGNTYTFKNTEFTIAGKGDGTIGMWGSALYGLDIYLTGNCNALEDKTITDLRINTTDGYIDFKVNHEDMISKTYKVFKSAFK